MADAYIYNEFHYWKCFGCSKVVYTNPKLKPCIFCGRKRPKKPKRTKKPKESS